jgi:hypothetical protein
MTVTVQLAGDPENPVGHVVERALAQLTNSPPSIGSPMLGLPRKMRRSTVARRRHRAIAGSILSPPPPPMPEPPTPRRRHRALKIYARPRDDR